MRSSSDHDSHPGFHDRRTGEMDNLDGLANTFLYLWSYEVLPESLDEFVDLYGSNGSWVELFRRAPGYLGTQLLLDRTAANRFVTIDSWESLQAFAQFRVEFADEFDRLDRLGERLTAKEVFLGEFGEVPGQQSA